jgi:hypothetical protein
MTKKKKLLILRKSAGECGKTAVSVEKVPLSVEKVLASVEKVKKTALASHSPAFAPLTGTFS